MHGAYENAISSKECTLFLLGPMIPGGSCSLSSQVIPLSYDLFMHPLHLVSLYPLKYIKLIKMYLLNLQMILNLLLNFLPYLIEQQQLI